MKNATLNQSILVFFLFFISISSIKALCNRENLITNIGFEDDVVMEMNGFSAGLTGMEITLWEITNGNMDLNNHRAGLGYDWGNSVI